MLPRNHPDRIQIAFDDHRLVANAGLILPATLALRLGLPQLLRKDLDPALALGGAVQPRPGPTASHSTPSLTASLQLTQRPRNLAPPRSRESPAAYPLAIPRIATPA